jgi:hypothetical protein
MSFLDKAKVAAEKAATKAQQGVQQGQAKIEELQDKRKLDALLRDLGSAYYDEERHGADHEPVVRALAAIDYCRSRAGCARLAGRVGRRRRDGRGDGLIGPPYLPVPPSLGAGLNVTSTSWSGRRSSTSA